MNDPTIDRYARGLFTCAALFNFCAGLPILLALPWMAQVIGMRPVPDSPLLAHLFGVLVLVFGWGYWQVARDPIANRPIIHMGIVGKTLVVLSVGYDFLMGNTNWPFALLVSGDAVFAALFAAYLGSRPMRASRGNGISLGI